MKKHIIKAFLTSIILSSFIIIEVGSFESIFQNLKKYNEEYYPEKVYLHTDRSVYAKEDTIWIKTYLVNGITHKPNTGSRIVHIDLIDPDKRVVAQQLAYVEEIGSANDIITGREWRAGKYLLRGYTKENTVSSKEYIFQKEIELLDINEEYKRYEENFGQGNIESEMNTSDIQLRFFPEGGQFVNGVKNRLAMKLKGISVSGIKGYVEDSDGNKISDFKIYEFGYGSINMTPEQGKKYRAIIDFDGKKNTFDLPMAQDKGYAMLVNSRFESIAIDIVASPNSSLSEGTIIGHTRGSVFLEKEVSVDDSGIFSIKIPTDNMKAGISHFTFFNGDGLPECERLVFVNNENVDIEIGLDKEGYGKREKVKIDIVSEETSDSDYDCSLSVVELNNLKINNATNIKTWLLLNSDLRGHIENATYFFEKEKDYKRAYLLDHVMMTNGWRRFTWSDMLDSDSFREENVAREKGLYVNGRTTKKLFSDNGQKSKCVLTFMDNNFTEQELVSDDEGYFSFGPYTSFDTLDAILQARRFKSGNEGLEGNKKLKIEIIDEDISPEVVWESLSANNSDYDAFSNFVVNNKTAQVLKDQYHMMSVELDEIIIKAKRNTAEKRVQKVRKSLSAYNSPTHTKTFEEGENFRYPDVYQMLETMPGIRVEGSPGSRTVDLGRGIKSFNASTEPLYLVNGRPTASLEGILPIEVDFIDVLKDANASAYGLRGANGVIAVYTTSRRTSIIDRKDGIVSLKLNGFYSGREFYSTDYSGVVSKVYTPDMRTTLHWDPLIKISPSSKSSEEFYTGDITGEFMVIIEGINSDGEVLHKTQTFVVH